VSQVSKGDQPSEHYESVLDKIEAPPTNFNLKQNALEYDIKLGWIPRSQIAGPIPLSFSSYINDEVIEKKMRSMIYLGYRPKHSFELHERYYEKGSNDKMQAKDTPSISFIFASLSFWNVSSKNTIASMNLVDAGSRKQSDRLLSRSILTTKEEIWMQFTTKKANTDYY
jgi:hypothetical protein